MMPGYCKEQFNTHALVRCKKSNHSEHYTICYLLKTKQTLSSSPTLLLQSIAETDKKWRIREKWSYQIKDIDHRYRLLRKEKNKRLKLLWPLLSLSSLPLQTHIIVCLADTKPSEQRWNWVRGCWLDNSPWMNAALLNLIQML